MYPLLLLMLMLLSTTVPIAYDFWCTSTTDGEGEEKNPHFFLSIFIFILLFLVLHSQVSDSERKRERLKGSSHVQNLTSFKSYKLHHTFLYVQRTMYLNTQTPHQHNFHSFLNTLQTEEHYILNSYTCSFISIPIIRTLYVRRAPWIYLISWLWFWSSTYLCILTSSQFILL